MINTSQVATPTFSPAGGTYPTSQSVTLSDATPNSRIYFTTDGSTPTTSSTAYTTPIRVSRTTTIMAMAVASGLSNSAVAAATYTINTSQVATPTFSPAGGTYPTSQSVTLSDATPNSTIYFTTDGSTPTTASTRYTTPISVTHSETIKAMAVASGLSNSAVAAATYTINTSQVATPTFSPGAGTYSTSQSVTISDTTPNATIYFTTDGSTPTTASTRYTTPISVTHSETIKALAVANGLTDSRVATATYTIDSGSGRGIDYGTGFVARGLQMNGSASINGTQLRLTNSGGFQASSAFATTPVNVQRFTTDFTIQLTNADADGMAFVLQGNSPTALGSPGAGLGYGVGTTSTASIANSVAVKFDLYDNEGEGPDSTGLYTGGVSPTIPAVNLSGTGIDLHSGHAFNVHIVYDGTTLAMTITDSTNTALMVRRNFTVNIPAAVGNSTAYAGFTAGTGGLTATMDVLTWTYQP
jgi:hypothetical protein